MLEQILKLLMHQKVKGKVLVGSRGVNTAALAILVLMAQRHDQRLQVIELRLGITNAPMTISVPFTSLTTNQHYEAEVQL